MENRISDKDIASWQEMVFNYVHYRLFDYHTAKDITAQTMALFWLICNYEEEAKIKGWLINTAKNQIKKYLTKISKENHNEIRFTEHLYSILPDDVSSENRKTFKEAYEEALTNLSKKEMEFLFTYFRCRQSIKKLHEIVPGSYSALRKRISRIKKKLKAETYRNLGFIGSKKIVTPELDNLIYQFLRRFKQNLEAGTLEKMYYYFSEIDLSEFNMKYDVIRIIDYDIVFKDSMYKVWTFYEDSQNNLDSFFIEFFIDPKNSLKIKTPPTKTKKIVTIEPDSDEGMKLKELFDQFPIGINGHPSIPQDEIKKIINEYEAKKRNSN